MTAKNEESGKAAGLPARKNADLAVKNTATPAVPGEKGVMPRNDAPPAVPGEKKLAPAQEADADNE